MKISPKGQAATFTSNVPVFARDLRATQDKMLASMGESYRASLEAKLRAGYGSGQFVTGSVAESVKVSEPQSQGLEKGRVVHVYTMDFKARLWEFGFQSAWSGRWERNPIWRMTAVDQGQSFAAIALESFGDMKRYWNPKWQPGRSHKRARR